MSEDSVIEAIDPPSERKMGAVDQSFYLIGVGVSAGGLDAIKQMISQIPSSFPHSLVIVQHISPDYKSLMSEILGRETSLPVIEVTDNLAVEAGHIYLIPPRSNIVIQGTKADSGSRLESGPTAAHSGLRFSLIGQTPRPGLNLPIDVFFHSLAEAVKDRAIAVVLSGSGSDGSRGLRAIKDREGFVLVQDPEVSAFDGMPRSSIATGIVDLVLSPDAIVGEINRYLEMRERGIDSVERVFSTVGDEFSELLTLVSEKAEIDFSLYKEPTLQRRIARRMALRGYSTLTEYLAHLRREPAELNVLYREFLVGVTNFFRDLPIWQNLEDTILPTLFREGEQSEPVRIWSAGCSTGEEAYTISMLMERFREENGLTREFRIFATDVNEASIQTAKQGIYPDNVREEIPDAFLKKGYLTFQSGTFTVASHIRNRIVFAEHNVTEDAPYTRTDLIVCRNMLIYLSPDVQAKIMTHFSFSLRKNGFLQLGAAETPGQHGAMFEAVAHKARIYRNTRQRDSMARRANQSADFPVAQFLPRSRRMPDRKNPHSSDINVLLNMTLEDSEACVCIVDDTSKVVRTFGEHSNLLHIPSSGFSANLLDLVDDRLRSSVALVLRRAEIEGSAEKRSVRLVDEDDIEIVDVLCRKISWEAQAVAFAVSFRTRQETTQPSATERVLPEAPDIPTQAYIQHLEGEVQSLQDMLSATAEDLGASNEELQTTNEELIASNEELQANNEETQSINEELHTLNAENADKIAQLEAATGGINNLLATADLGVLVLDDKLCIRQFSAGLNRYVYLEAGDVGRPFENFAMTLEAEGVVKLMDDARMSRSSGEESSRELRGRDGGFAFCRVRPYRNVHGDHRGVVITLQDITDQKLLEREVRSQRDRLEGLLESEAAGYWDWDVDEDTLYMSPCFKAMFGYQDDEVPNTPHARLDLIHPEDVPLHEKALAAHVLSEGAELYDLELRHLHKDGAIVWVLSRGRVVEWNDARQPKRMMGVHVDVSALKQREEEVHQRAEEVRRFAFIAAHDLIQPMNTIDSCISMLCEDLPIGEDPEQVEMIGYLTSSTARMKERINGVLDYARLMDQEVSPEMIPLKPVVNDTLSDLKSQIDVANAEIVVEDLPAALGAASLISRVFQNLISNGLKYRRSDRTCRIEIGSVPAPSGMVKIRVMDNGVGIEPKHRRKVFELFARLHTEDEVQGRGMGLSLCERIVARLGGTIAIEDGRDGGSAFTFTLRSE